MKLLLGWNGSGGSYSPLQAHHSILKGIREYRVGTRISDQCFFNIMDDAQIWFKEGVTLYEKGDYPRAIAAFDKALARDPTLAEAWNNRGLSLIQTGDYREALKSINKALSLDPGHENARKAKRVVLGLIKDTGDSDAVPGPAGSSAPQGTGAPDRKRSALVVVAVIVILAIAACGVVVVKNMQSTGSILPFATPTPTPVPTLLTPVPTATVVPTPTQPIVPSSGIWVEISYDQYYSGSVGTPSAQQMLSGSLQVKPNTGTQFYQILQNNGFVTASVSKNDGSGDNLTVSIFMDGTLVKTASTSTPYGNLDVVAAFPTPGSPPVVNSSGPINLPAGAGA
jgi:tetratricopeptide (TPR) repeat protein